MNLTISGHHLEVTPALRGYVSPPSSERISRHFDRWSISRMPADGRQPEKGPAAKGRRNATSHVKSGICSLKVPMRTCTLRSMNWLTSSTAGVALQGQDPGAPRLRQASDVSWVPGGPICPMWMLRCNKPLTLSSGAVTCHLVATPGSA